MELLRDKLTELEQGVMEKTQTLIEESSAQIQLKMAEGKTDTSREIGMVSEQLAQEKKEREEAAKKREAANQEMKDNLASMSQGLQDQLDSLSLQLATIIEGIVKEQAVPESAEESQAGVAGE